MDDLDLDFAVTYNGQYIFSKDRVLFTSPISKLHLRHLISYAKKEGTEIALGPRMPCWVLKSCPLVWVLFPNELVASFLCFNSDGESVF